ncbi:SMI1/KNR4 family protein [Streptomyces sp. NPDC054833]
MTDEIAVRQVTEAWQRIETWLRRHAPATHAALGPGARREEIDAVEATLGFAVPVELRTLWSLVSGGVVDDRGFWGDHDVLIPLDEVVETYQRQMRWQAEEEATYDTPGVPGEGDAVFWQRPWIPVFSLGPHDTMYGTYLNAETGLMWKWTREVFWPPTDDDPQESLVTHLEKLADALEYPDLADDKAGLVNGALVWKRQAYADEDWHAAGA